MGRRPFVGAILCFTRANFFGVKSVGNAKVMPASELLGFFSGKFAEVFSDIDVERIKAWIAVKRRQIGEGDNDRRRKSLSRGNSK
ncbi:MAG: hypothetical protein NZ781_12415 [Armatimonadetes bacterium]|nr:hypothetical protein [Armatimonadota bacterium]